LEKECFITEHQQSSLVSECIQECRLEFTNICLANNPRMETWGDCSKM